MNTYGDGGGPFNPCPDWVIRLSLIVLGVSVIYGLIVKVFP